MARIAYADPPYINCAYRYADQPDYGGEVDHAELLVRLASDYDGFILHAAATSASFAQLGSAVAAIPGARWCAWVKSFAAFKSHVPVAYAWEPVIIKPVRQPIVSGVVVMRDWVRAPITMQRGFVGAKPDIVCQWAFALVGAQRDDDLIDLFPGSGAVLRAWQAWQCQGELFVQGI